MSKHCLSLYPSHSILKPPVNVNHWIWNFTEFHCKDLTSSDIFNLNQQSQKKTFVIYILKLIKCGQLQLIPVVNNLYYEQAFYIKILFLFLKSPFFAELINNSVVPFLECVWYWWFAPRILSQLESFLPFY